MQVTFKGTNKIALQVCILMCLGATQVFTQASMAQEFVEIKDVKACREIQSSAERLLCYDTVIDNGIYNQQVLQQLKTERFGKIKTDPDVETGELAVTIVRIEEDAYGKKLFYTSDGQVWKQLKREYWGSKAPVEAQVKGGALGSYFLESEKYPPTRVKRVK